MPTKKKTVKSKTKKGNVSKFNKDQNGFIVNDKLDSKFHEEVVSHPSILVLRHKDCANNPNGYPIAYVNPDAPDWVNQVPQVMECAGCHNKNWTKESIVGQISVKWLLAAKPNKTS